MKSVFALIAFLLAAPHAGLAWMTDLSVAQNRAYAENRLVLINFTGSDWCGWCIKLKNEVFSKPEFLAFAERHLMLVEVDFPRRKPMSPQQRAINEGLASKYGVDGYPTVVLLNSKGNRIGELGYMEGGPAAFIKAIRRIAGLPATDTGAGAGPGGGDSPAPNFGGAKVGPPPKYTELTLKSISGSGTKRLALINNQTLAVGESGKVRLGDTEVKVRLEEIRETSVIITIDGKRKELPLKTS